MPFRLSSQMIMFKSIDAYGLYLKGFDAETGDIV
jgi:hypothetical protein